MLEINAILTIALRDFTKLLRDRFRLAVSFIFPIIFIGALGTSLQSNIGQFISFLDNDEEQAGQSMLTDLEELESFFKKLFPESPLCLMSVGHSAALSGLFHRVIKERRKGFSFM